MSDIAAAVALSSSPPVRPTRNLKRPLEDLPIFSSDPAEPSIDSDNAPKRLYRGPWWNHARHSSPSLSRNFDSGIYLPSDDSLASLAEFEPLDCSKNSHSAEKPFVNYHFSLSTTSTNVDHANQILDDVLDQGDEVVDLSNLDLDSLPSSFFNRLSTVVKIPQFLNANGSYSPSEEHFHSLRPTIQVFLANNSLSSLPLSTWNLETLTVLSLRNNNITNLPSSISRLRNLVELNVANNNLRWLPWELLHLIGPGKPLTKILVLPNPLVRGIQLDDLFPKENDWRIPPSEPEFRAMADELRRGSGLLPATSVSMASSWMFKLMEGLWKLMKQKADDEIKARGPQILWENSSTFSFSKIFVAASDPTYFRTDGTPPNGTLPLSAIQGDFIPARTSPATRTRSSVAPSLLELAVSACSAYPDLDSLEALLENPPKPVVRALRAALAAREEGGRLCSVCDRKYIIPRTEWIEYWHIVPLATKIINVDELFWPFIRRGCSRGCVEIM
jgi:hypothetical protein